MNPDDKNKFCNIVSLLTFLDLAVMSAEFDDESVELETLYIFITSNCLQTSTLPELIDILSIRQLKVIKQILGQHIFNTKIHDDAVCCSNIVALINAKLK